ncbi:MAG: rhodanese-like domain-containing protein [Gemmataceae bacterium]
MANQSSTMVDAPRISPEDLKARMKSGEPFTAIDVRNPAAWGSSNAKIPGAFRAEAGSFRVEPSWPKDRLTVVY